MNNDILSSSDATHKKCATCGGAGYIPMPLYSCGTGGGVLIPNGTGSNRAMFYRVPCETCCGYGKVKV